jgi:hypothetical protein
MVTHPYAEWRKQFTTPHVCRVCGERATIVEDEGWACDTHQVTLTKLTPAECETLIRYARGAEFSGAARRMLGEFLDERGWTGRENEAIEIAQRHWENRSKWAKMGTTSYCEICGNGGAGVTWYGNHRCDKHWELPPDVGGAEDGQQVRFDKRTGFALTDAS